MEPDAAELVLRRGADRRLRGGHLWIYSNEVDSQRTPLGRFEAGDTVGVLGADGRLLGSAYVEPHALICARLYAPGQLRALDQSLIAERLNSALALRERLFDDPCYRLVYGDSDGLPGLVVDRFRDYLVAQLNSPAIECFREPLLSALAELLNPAGILLRGDSRSRRQQGLATDSEVVFGEVPEHVPLSENGVDFLAPVHHGQKTHGSPPQERS